MENNNNNTINWRDYIIELQEQAEEAGFETIEEAKKAGEL